MKPAHALPLGVLAAVLSSALSTSLPAQGWTNLGSGKSGTLGVPILVPSALQVGAPLTVDVLSARPSAPAFLVAGGRRADLPILGGVLVPSTDFLLPAVTDAAGKGSVRINLPNNPRFAAMRPILQWVIADPLATRGAAFSNATEGTFCTWLSTVEDFRSAQSLDADRSAGTWGNGSVQFSSIGGPGIHGDFDPTLGKDISTGPSRRIYEWDLDKGVVVPRTHTTTGKDELVTDGRFFFQRMVVPSGVEVRFVGSVAARLSVCGRVDVHGTLAANGDAHRVEDFNTRLNSGETGSRGGAMGGSGGAGGDRGDGVAHKVAFDGRPGTDVVLLNGHRYAGRFNGSGGQGSPQFPLNGQSSSIRFTYFNVISQQCNRGGGGGGFTGPGGTGQVFWPHGAPGVTPGGNSGLFPSAFPTYTNGFTHQDHFVAGGSGGGGSGSSCGGAIQSIPLDYWVPGRGGAGGGGALALRIGGSLNLSGTGTLEARGGSAPVDDANFAVRRMAAPGGGGSGGSLFLQVEGATRNTGMLTTAGGTGGVVSGHPSDTVFAGMISKGGNGSSGIVFFETAQPPTGYPVGASIPPAQVQSLDPKEADKLVAVRSSWYPTALSITPRFLRYEIDATVDGKRVKFSDDPLVAPLAGPGAPLRLLVQGAVLQRNANGELEVKPNTAVTGWLSYVGPHGRPALFDSTINGYRFELTLDRTQGKAVTVHSVTVYWCP